MTFTFTAHEAGHFSIATILYSQITLCSTSLDPLNITYIDDHMQPLLKVEGDIQACEEVSFTIEWTDAINRDFLTRAWVAQLNTTTVATLEPLTCTQ